MLRTTDIYRNHSRWLDHRPGGGSVVGGSENRVSYAPDPAAAGKRIADLALRWNPFYSQHRFYHLPSEYKGFSGPVGTGKSKALCYEAVRLAFANPGCTGLIGAPTYPMLRDSTRVAFIEVLEEEEIPYTFNRSENRFRIKGIGSQIIFRSLDHPERIRGTNLAWFGIDEMTYCKRAAWERLEARMRDPKARRRCAFGAWTPKGYDWVYQRFIGVDKLPGHEAILALPGENTVVLSAKPNYYSNLKSSYDEKFYQQEALGLYLDVYAGRVYHGYQTDRNDAEQIFSPQDPNGLCWAIDFNVDPMASLLAQFRNGELHCLDEIMLPDATTDKMCERIADRCLPYLRAWQDANGTAAPMPLRLYGDSSGNARSTKASKTDYDLIKEFFRARPEYKLRDYVPNANPAVKDRVNSVNALLVNAAGRVRTWIDPKCRALRRDLVEVSWKVDAAGFEIDKKKDSKLTHISDALGYLVWHEAPVDAFKREIIRN